MAKYPVFIIGSPRSGTSALAEGMLRAGYNGFREGNFLSLLTVLGRFIDRHFATFGNDGPKVLASVVDKEALMDSIAVVFRDVVNRHNPDAPWFDKTGNPEMIEAIPTLLELWPESVFIFAKRRAIENIVSRLKKFPGHNFEYHCRDWARNMEAWRLMRDKIPRDKYVEVDQQDLIRDPTTAAAAIGHLLDLADANVAAMTQAFQKDRPQETEAGTARRVLALADLWDEPRRALFERLCGPEMKAYGYSFDESYWEGA
ncbi:sulfotransferase [Rhodoblastus acidophilus]|uniref:Sulfotransferase n=1 Tax=Candidatus Rhodoblastus alkanivorans TaxID=2954117 RepID=A0ABS9Z326_9HYPH|nr:sulfotransferase [Candidatus Rhodoblastus alkanivorans]MCI4677344.1 sulfotransferase [Candidatus Rhodoblastus alkanivorans]MCI4682079.1 sulfotransferase [Candidatus Rhodoblastus alkanivorans]MDI4639381.1 sulfotransferase [Rhodoblastus acidophilus]